MIAEPEVKIQGMIKGLAIIPLFKFIQKHDLNWHAILNQLPDHCKTELSLLIKSQYTLHDFFPTPQDGLKLFSALRWYPIVISNGFLVAIARQMHLQYGVSLERGYYAIGHFTATHDLSGLLGYILRWGNILQMLEMGEKIWKHYISEGELIVISKAEGRIQFDIVCSVVLSEQQYVNQGWLAALLEKKEIAQYKVETMYLQLGGGTITHKIIW